MIFRISILWLQVLNLARGHVGAVAPTAPEVQRMDAQTLSIRWSPRIWRENPILSSAPSLHIYICSPPPQDLLFASFCLPKVLPESFLHNLKEKQKNKKNKKQPKKKKNWGNSEETLAETFPSGFCFFCFFFCFFVFFGLFGLRLLRAYSWQKHFPLPAFGIHYFPKKTAFPIIFPAIYFKLLSLKTGLFNGQ